MTSEPTSAAPSRNSEHMPSRVDDAGLFDRFAEASSSLFARPRFFGLCVAIVVLWAASYFVIEDKVEWKLLIHTVTGVITFLMVALLQNSENRSDEAAQAKLNAIAAALAQLMIAQPQGSGDLDDAVRELSEAVGLESVDPA